MRTMCGKCGACISAFTRTKAGENKDGSNISLKATKNHAALRCPNCGRLSNVHLDVKTLPVEPVFMPRWKGEISSKRNCPHCGQWTRITKPFPSPFEKPCTACGKMVFWGNPTYAFMPCGNCKRMVRTAWKDNRFGHEKAKDCLNFVTFPVDTREVKPQDEKLRMENFNPERTRQKNRDRSSEHHIRIRLSLHQLQRLNELLVYENRRRTSLGHKPIVLSKFVHEFLAGGEGVGADFEGARRTEILAVFLSPQESQQLLEHRLLPYLQTHPKLVTPARAFQAIVLDWITTDSSITKEDTQRRQDEQEALIDQLRNENSTVQGLRLRVSDLEQELLLARETSRLRAEENLLLCLRLYRAGKRPAGFSETMQREAVEIEKRRKVNAAALDHGNHDFNHNEIQEKKTMRIAVRRRTLGRSCAPPSPK